MRINFDRERVDPPEQWISAADEREDAIRCMGLKHRHKDDSDQKQPDRDDAAEDPEDILPGDFATQEEYEDALEDAGIDPDDAIPWEDRANY